MKTRRYPLGTRFLEWVDFVGYLTPRRIWNLVQLRISYALSLMLRAPVHRGMPASISIEPASGCNLHCPECPTGLGHLSRKKSLMSGEDFFSVIDQVKKSAIAVSLYFQGEPFIHPGLIGMISYASKHKLFSTVSTNGQFLPGIDMEELVMSGLNRLIVSADGITQLTYETYRIGGSLEKLMQGLKKIAEAKKKLHSKKPLLILQFLVMRHNQYELPLLEEWAVSAGADAVLLKSPQIDSLEGSGDILPTIERFNRYTPGENGRWKVKSDLPDRCWRMWHGSIIDVNGDILPCCFDKDAGFVIGNIQQQRIHEVWHSRTYDKFREGVLSNRKSIAMCTNCTENLEISASELKFVR